MAKKINPDLPGQRGGATKSSVPTKAPKEADRIRQERKNASTGVSKGPGRKKRKAEGRKGKSKGSRSKGRKK